ncbi:hypothetical protein [Legionella shakespearei]|uniref:Uncharacterized protein n=1 Tax=Legionella shakespearei DSM 23087 TaxID=1122169 RepID=A0A0W0YW63_9GAMM|nr:hypothetical protein [Legionella shakespearei]KTD61067.1 hypothetical protein Lsha_1314 [Legionella shakespearei DSM 23087]
MPKKTIQRSPSPAPRTHSPDRNSVSSLATDGIDRSSPSDSPLTPREAAKDSFSSLRNLFRTSSTALRGRLSGGSRTPSLESSPRDMYQEETHEPQKKEKEPESFSSTPEDSSDDIDDLIIPQGKSDSNASVPSLAEMLPTIQMPAGTSAQSFNSTLRSPRIIDETHKLVFSTFLLQINSSFLKTNGPSFFPGTDKSFRLSEYLWHTPETLTAYARFQEPLEMERLKTLYIIQLTDLFDEFISKPYAELNAHTDEEYKALYDYLLETLKILGNPMVFMKPPLQDYVIESQSPGLLQSEHTQVSAEYIDKLRKQELRNRAEFLVARLRFQHINANPPLAKPLFELLQQLRTSNAEERYSLAIDGIVNTLVQFQMCKNYYQSLSSTGPSDYMSLKQLFQMALGLSPEETQLITQSYIKKLYQELALKLPECFGLFKETVEPDTIFLPSFSVLLTEVQGRLNEFAVTHEKIPYTNELRPNLNKFIIINRLAEILNPLFIRAIQGVEKGMTL